MFEKTLLDSSSGRVPALHPVHWLLSLGIGLLGFAVGSMALPVEAARGAAQILLLRAAVLGGALMFYALAVCYTHADARRQGLNAWFWSAEVMLMNLPGFLAYLVYSALETGDWKRATFPIAYTFEALLVGFAALMPLIYTQALPGAFRMVASVPPLPRGVTESPSRPERTRGRVTPTSILITPSRIPEHIPDFAPETPNPPDTGIGVIGVPEGPIGSQDGVLTGILSPNSVPPPPAPKPATIKRVTLGGQVEAAKAIFKPDPLYPPLAITARVQGTVRIHAIIGTDGTVQQLKVLSGNPLLINAARDAVAIWRYQPTLLNGEPVEVDTEIEVKFVLNN